MKKGGISRKQVGGKSAYDLLGKGDLRLNRIGSVSLNGRRPDVTLIGDSYQLGSQPQDVLMGADTPSKTSSTPISLPIVAMLLEAPL